MWIVTEMKYPLLFSLFSIQLIWLDFKERFDEQRIYCTHINTLSVLPSCRASFMTDAPLGGSRLQADLKKGSTCLQASSPGFMPSHIPLKRRTFSSSRDIISVSFCLNKSDQQRQTGKKGDRQWGKQVVLFGADSSPFSFPQTLKMCFSHLSSPWLWFPVVSCHLPSHWESLHPHPSLCSNKEKTKMM